jgi:hypothetical protein
MEKKARSVDKIIRNMNISLSVLYIPCALLRALSSAGSIL